MQINIILVVINPFCKYILVHNNVLWIRFFICVMSKDEFYDVLLNHLFM